MFSKSFDVSFGPYIALGIGGKNKYRSNGIVEKIDFDFGPGERPFTAFVADDTPLRTLGYGLNTGLGYSKGAMTINLGFGFGLSNMFPHYTDGFGQVVIDSNDIKMSNRVISLSVTHFLKE